MKDIRNPILSTDDTTSSINNTGHTGYTRRSQSKKIILIMIIVLIAIIILGGGIFAYTYFFTDAFLSEEQGFYKYISQNSQILEMFKDQDLNNYIEKTQNEAHTNNGELSIAFSGDIDEETKQITDEIQKHKIIFNSNVDSINKYSDYGVNLKYEENDVISGSVVQQNDYFGLKVNDIGLNPYIVLENNNLKQFAKNLGLSDEEIASIPDKIDIESMLNYQLFTDEELEGIKERYLKAITDNLTEDMFNKSNQDGVDVYTLTINEEKGKAITVSIIDTLKNDEVVLNKLKQLYIEQQTATEEEAQALIEELKKSLEDAKNDLNGTSSNTYEDLNSVQSDMIQQETTEESENLYISVYVLDRNLTKTEIFMEKAGKWIINNSGNKASLEILVAENENNSIDLSNTNLNVVDENQSTETTYKTTGIFSIEKNKADNELSYILAATAIDEGKNKEILKVTATYTGLGEMANVEANLLIDIYNYPNDSILAAAQNASIESKNVEEQEKVTLALNSLIVKLYEDTYVSGSEFVINETTIKEYMEQQNLDMTVSRNEDGTYRLQSNITGNIFTVDSQGKITNTEYAETASTDEAEEKIIVISLNVKGNTTFGAVEQQDLSNKYLVNDKSLEELESLFTQLGERIGNKFVSAYNNTIIGQMVEEYNEGGVITPQPDLSDISEQEIQAFNVKFTPYEGTAISGPQVNALIQSVIASNQSEISGSQHYIKIEFPSTSGKSQEINVKDNKVTYTDSNAENRVATGKQYNVTLKYNDNGIVNEIIVKEK